MSRTPTPYNNNRPCNTFNVARSSRNQPFGLASVPFGIFFLTGGTRTRLHAFRSPRQWATVRTPTKLSALNRSVLSVEHPLSKGRPLRS